jgi:hypothetical protein
MILKTVQVLNYRCIEDSNTFTVGPVTCLVGKNESGKTAVLQALERLKPSDDSKQKYNRVTDYPRKWLNDYDERNPNGDAVVLHTQWELCDADVAALDARLTPGCLLDRTVTISKTYEHDNVGIGIQLDHAKIIRLLSLNSGCTPDEQAELKALKTSDALAKYVADKSEPSPGLQALKLTLTALNKGLDFHIGAVNVVYERMPSFLYFSNYDRMNGRVSIEDLIAKRQAKKLDDSDKVFLAFLDFAKVSLDELRDAKKSEELRAKCEEHP